MYTGLCCGGVVMVVMNVRMRPLVSGRVSEDEDGWGGEGGEMGGTS
jgi:hypothetical protein